MAAVKLAPIGDTGWQTVSALGGTLAYRRLNGTVYVEGADMTVPNQTATSVTTLPTGYRPTVRHTGGVAFPLGVKAYVNVTTDGLVQVISQQGAALSPTYFSAAFPV